MILAIGILAGLAVLILGGLCIRHQARHSRAVGALRRTVFDIDRDRKRMVLMREGKSPTPAA